MPYEGEKYSWSVTRDADNNLLIRLHTFNSETGRMDLGTLWRVPPSEIPDLIRSVSAEGAYALQDVAQSMARGDCATCKNVRLVDEETRGRISRVHCPDCQIGGSGSGSEVPFSEYPRVGGGTEHE